MFFGASIGGRLPFKYLKYFQPRLEGEISYTSNDVSSGSFNDGTQTFSGQQSALFLSFNSYSDIIWKDNQRIVPYLGGSIGIADVDTDIEYFGAAATAPVFGVFENSTNFTTVSSAGVTLRATEKLDIYTEARYYTIYDLSLIHI